MVIDPAVTAGEDQDFHQQTSGAPAPEVGLVFYCDGEELVGLLHPAATAAPLTGVLVVVGGPQYRVGSHRQFVLLARQLSASGIPVLRFDYRGMGDSGGASRDFSSINRDIATAIDAFLVAVPGLQKVILWGLCDAATAAAIYAPADPRVAGVVLLNPWVRTDAGIAQTHLRHYYHRRLLQPEFWRKLFRLRFDWRASLLAFRDLLELSGWLPGRRTPAAGRTLPQQMAEALAAFHGPALIVLSGNDLTAAEFRDSLGVTREWQVVMRRPSVAVREFPKADHTFSRREWRDQVSAWTLDWVCGHWFRAGCGGDGIPRR